MKHRTGIRWLVMLTTLLVMALVMVGCGGKEEEPEPQAKTPLLLPRFTVSLSDEGVPKVLGIPLDRLGGVLRQDFSGLTVDPQTVQLLKSADIQNLEAVATADGVYLYVNGKPVPYLALDEETRQNVGDLLGLVGVDDRTANVVQNLLNNKTIGRVGVPVVIKLPVAAGASEAALRDSKDLPRVDTDQAPLRRRREGADLAPGRGAGRGGRANARRHLADRLPGSPARGRPAG